MFIAQGSCSIFKTLNGQFRHVISLKPHRRLRLVQKHSSNMRNRFPFMYSTQEKTFLVHVALHKIMGTLALTAHLTNALFAKYIGLCVTLSTEYYHTNYVPSFSIYASTFWNSAIAFQLHTFWLSDVMGIQKQQKSLQLYLCEIV